MRIKPELKITIIYLLLGIVWILLSDRFLLLFFSDYELKKITYLQTVKGFFYVVSTAMLLYLMLRRHYKIIHAKMEQLEHYTQELETSNKELEQYAYVASHDLQEPLRMVISFISKLEAEYKDRFDEKGKRYVGFVLSGARRMRTIILDLLDYSKIGKESPAKEAVATAAIVDEILLLYHETLELKNVRLRLCELPVVHSDPTALFQVFYQIIGNALKYTRNIETPELTIAAEETPKEWVFSVADNGIGIEKQYFDKIFLLFQRLHSDKEFAGNGIGLAIVKKNIDRLNGRVWLVSEKEQGTTFYFALKKQILK